jgi:hypothetical protein
MSYPKIIFCLWLSNQIHFPSLYHGHWFLFAVDMRVRKFLFMDSLCGEASDLHKEVDDMMVCYIETMS